MLSVTDVTEGADATSDDCELSQPGSGGAGAPSAFSFHLETPEAHFSMMLPLMVSCEWL